MTSLQEIADESKDFKTFKTTLENLKNDLWEFDSGEYNEWMPVLIAFLRHQKIALDSKECESLNFTHVKIPSSFEGSEWSSSVLRDLRIVVVPNPIMFKHLRSWFKNPEQFCQLMIQIAARGCDPHFTLGFMDSRRADLMDISKDETDEEFQKSIKLVYPILFKSFEENLVLIEEDKKKKELFNQIDNILDYNQVYDYGKDSFQHKFIQSILTLNKN